MPQLEHLVANSRYVLRDKPHMLEMVAASQHFHRNNLIRGWIDDLLIFIQI